MREVKVKSCKQMFLTWIMILKLQVYIFHALWTLPQICNFQQPWLHLLYFELQEAYQHVLRCCPSIRPNRGFVEQLSSWEEEIHGQKLTDIEDPNFWTRTTICDILLIFVCILYFFVQIMYGSTSNVLKPILKKSNIQIIIYRCLSSTIVATNLQLRSKLFHQHIHVSKSRQIDFCYIFTSFYCKF